MHPPYTECKHSTDSTSLASRLLARSGLPEIPPDHNQLAPIPARTLQDGSGPLPGIRERFEGFEGVTAGLCESGEEDFGDVVFTKVVE